LANEPKAKKGGIDVKLRERVERLKNEGVVHIVCYDFTKCGASRLYKAIGEKRVLNNNIRLTDLVSEIVCLPESVDLKKKTRYCLVSIKDQYLEWRNVTTRTFGSPTESDRELHLVDWVKRVFRDIGIIPVNNFGVMIVRDPMEFSDRYLELPVL